MTPSDSPGPKIGV